MWKANGKTTTLYLFLDSLSPKTEKLRSEETMDLSRDRLILELEFKIHNFTHSNCRTDVSNNNIVHYKTLTPFNEGNNIYWTTLPKTLKTSKKSSYHSTTKPNPVIKSSPPT
jgi:hypothetical protein